MRALGELDKVLAVSQEKCQRDAHKYLLREALISAGDDLHVFDHVGFTESPLDIREELLEAVDGAPIDLQLRHDPLHSIAIHRLAIDLRFIVVVPRDLDAQIPPVGWFERIFVKKLAHHRIVGLLVAKLSVLFDTG